MIDVVRSLWEAVEHASPVDQLRLKRDITATIGRLKSRIEGHTRSAKPAPTSLPLFDQGRDGRPKKAKNPALPRFPVPELHFYDKDLADQALEQLPKLAHCQTLDDVRSYLAANLSDEQQVEAEDDYRICVRRGSEFEAKPKLRKMNKSDD